MSVDEHTSFGDIHIELLIAALAMVVEAYEVGTHLGI